MIQRLGITALGRRCTLTRRSKNNPNLAIGKMQDVHTDFLGCVVDWLEGGEVQQVIHGKDFNYVISCVKEDVTSEVGEGL
jgi:hypothetical protein